LLACKTLNPTANTLKSKTKRSNIMADENDDDYLDELASDVETLTPVPDGSYDMVAGKTAPEF
jgi:hypothetical protein